MNNYCHTMECVQRNVNHTYNDYFSVIFWFINQLNQLVIDIVKVFVGLTYLSAWVIVVLVVLYANFGQRVRIPEGKVLIYAANPERYNS